MNEDELPDGVEQFAGFTQYDVDDIQAAIALGERFKANGRYRYFRGQRDAKWAVTSSFGRTDKALRQKEIDKFAAFYGWIKDSPELVPYLTDDDMIIATAQHHGVAATTLIDFTTEPAIAAWFAADGRIEGDDGAIFLVDDEAEKAIGAFGGSDLIIRFLFPDVANLWRLQAQKGLFLETQIDIHHVWPLDRIIFRQSAAAPAIERRHIYPDRRSHLEQMIDQHLLLQEREEKMRRFFEGGSFHQIEIEAPDLPLPGLPLRGMPENLQRAVDERWPLLDVDSEAPTFSPDEIEAGSAGFRQAIEVRRESLDLVNIEPDPVRRNGTHRAAIDRLWSGMRPHPYDVEQLAGAASALIRFNRVFGDYSFGDGSSPMRVAGGLFTEPIEIEMGIAGGGSTRAGVTAIKLWQALTPEAQNLLGLLEEPNGSALKRALLPYYGNTLRLFDKGALVDLFADEIIPWQVVTRRDPIAFWPEHITSLGPP